MLVYFNGRLEYGQIELPGTLAQLDLIHHNVYLPQIHLIFVVVTHKLLVQLTRDLPKITTVGVVQVKLL